MSVLTFSGLFGDFDPGYLDSLAGDCQSPYATDLAAVRALCCRLDSPGERIHRYCRK